MKNSRNSTSKAIKPASGKKRRSLNLRERGFALVITVCLLVLLTLLALGMLTLSTISLRQGESAMAMATARSNAKLAMFLAIGELQRSAGADQRATGTADLAAGDSAGNLIKNGASPANNQSVRTNPDPTTGLPVLTSTPNGLTSLQAGTRYWTGVWTSSFANNDTNPLDIYTQTPAPKILQWLVSGNEITQLSSNSPSITPASSNYGLNPTGVPNNDPNGNPYTVVLAGTNTVGTAALNISHYVSAPLVPITQSTSSGKQTVGRYAWWVGDEGVKAKFNLVTPYKQKDTATYPYLAAQRRGWEAVQYNNNNLIPYKNYLNYSFLGTNPSAAKTVTLPSAALLDSSFSTTYPGMGASPLQNDFHAATTDSYGVLADTLQGGLRLDLSAYLANGLPASGAEFGGIMNPPLSGTNIIPNAVAPYIMGPKWDRLQSFYTTCTANPATLQAKQSASNADYAVSPAIVDLRMLLGMQIQIPPNAKADTFCVNPCAKITVSLANPYSRPISWGAMQLQLLDDTPSGNTPECIWELNSNGNGHAFFSPSHPAVFKNTFFQIPAGSLQPGQAQAYTHGLVIRPNADTSVCNVAMHTVDANTGDFTQCLILTDSGQITVSTTGQALDSRESWTTSLATVQLTLQSTSGNNSTSPTILRRIEHFELDDAPFTSNQHTFYPTSVAGKPHYTDYLKPVPLILHCFQLSQPGADYASILPAGQLGVRCTTMRTFADFNVQATRFRKTLMCYTPPPYFQEISDSLISLPFLPDSQAGSGSTGPQFTQNLFGSPLAWGRDGTSVSKTILFSFPTSFVSLAQFQHADLTADDEYVSVGHQPGNAVGNSYATPYVKRYHTVQSRADCTVIGSPNENAMDPNPVKRDYYDISYLLNASLWDTYFFSTIPGTGGASAVPQNPQIVKINPSDTSPDLTDGLKASGHLFVNGAFNVNATEVDAWISLLSSNKFLSMPNDTGTNTEASLYPRSLEQLASTKGGENDPTAPSGVGDGSYSGYRRLSDAQINAVAQEMARQVRLRGPFVSLSQFVNRALIDIGTSTETARSGALQCGLDQGGANISIDGTKSVFTGLNTAAVTNAITDRMNLQAESTGTPRADMIGLSPRTKVYPPSPNPGADWPWPTLSYDLNCGTCAAILADQPMIGGSSSQLEQGFRSTGIPGWLTQADLLQAIGPSITSRSDSFRIRAYGEADDASGKTTAKAWCEAVVQRYPTYLDTTGNVPSDRGTLLSTINKTFGRQFKIIAFRWLSPNEI